MHRFMSCAFALLFATAAQASPNLVTNGSFELGPAALGSFDGWTVVQGDASTFVDSDGQTGTAFGQASDGLWSAFFGSTAASGGASIAQSLSTTIGQRYVLGLDIANDNGGTTAFNRLIAAVNGAALYTLTNAADSGYFHVAIPFFASGTSTTLRLSAYNDNGYFDIDRVSVNAVPEPGMEAVALAGALALGIARRRRSRLQDMRQR